MIFLKKKKRKSQFNLLVDGRNLFYRSYMGSISNEYLLNNNINGILFFLKTIRTIIRENFSEGTTYTNVIFFFDGESSGILRSKIYPKYKFNRRIKYLIESQFPQYKDNFKLQEQQLKTLLSKSGFTVIDDNIVEADDMIAYYAKNNIKSRIVTNDSDLCGLINENTSIYYLNEKDKKRGVVDLTNWEDFFNIHPKNIFIKKILCGDNADQIEGIKGLGEKTLLKYFDLKQPINLETVLTESRKINEYRDYQLKKPLACFINLINNESTINTNKLLIDLNNPLLTDNVKNKLNNIKTNKINVELFASLLSNKLLNELNTLSDSKKMFFETFIELNKNLL